MSDYTPTTEEVRSAHSSYLMLTYGYSADQRPDIGLLFDRWLAAHDATVRADERARVGLQVAEMKACYTVEHDATDDHLSWDFYCRGHLIAAVAAARGEDTSHE